MFKRFILFVLVSLIATIFVLPARAAGAPWTAWLYETQIGRMTQVDSSYGTVKQIQLPAEAGATYSHNIAVSQDGTLVAYGATNASTNNVYVYNLVTNSNVFEFNVPPDANTSFEFGGSPLNYSEDNSTFAFGYGGVGMPWTLVVIDLKALSASSLKQSDPIAAGLGDTGPSYIPVVAYNRNKQISFLMIPYGTDGRPTYQSFTWNRDTNSITTNDAYVTPDTSTFIPTNEVLSTISDDRFPGSRLQDTGFPVNNTLQVFDPQVNQRFIVTSLAGIYDPQFIQAGERVALSQYYSQTDGTQIQSLLIVDRSGVVSNPVNGAPQEGINGILGTQDGFLFSATSGGIDSKSNGTDVLYVETRQANGNYNAVTVWSSSLGANGRLIWVSDMTPAAGTFAPWGQMQPPAGDGAGVDVNTGIPVGDSAYAVGVTALVQTTDNDVLNMRSGPGLNFARLGTIPNGTLVTLIEGPQNADGLIWWRVRLPDGTEGWVVAAVDGINTLLPQ